MFWWRFVLGNMHSLHGNGHRWKMRYHPNWVSKSKKKKKRTSLMLRTTQWQMVKFQQLKRSKTLWAFNEWNMLWERDLSINPNPGSLIKPFNTVSEYVDTRLQHFLIIFNSRHIFPFNWHSEMPLQFYRIGTKFSRDTATHFWILIRLIAIVIVKLFLKYGSHTPLFP